MPITERRQPTSILHDSIIFIEESSIPSSIDYDLGEQLPGSAVVDMYFVNSSGEVTDATAGTVAISGSLGESPWPFRNLASGEFNAADANTATLSLPNAYGNIRRLRFEFNGVTGVNGFRAAITQRAY
jgi:hypothetical protein